MRAQEQQQIEEELARAKPEAVTQDVAETVTEAIAEIEYKIIIGAAREERIHV